MTVNGKPGSLSDFKEGAYEIEVENLPPDMWADPTGPAASQESATSYSAKASSSHEEGGWGISRLFSPELGKGLKGYSSAPHASADAAEWLEIDLGKETALAQLVLMPRNDTLTADNKIAGFPLDFTVQLAREPGQYTTVKTFADCPVPGADGMVLDLYTVIGYPVARYIRLTATRLGPPARDDAAHYRLQLRRLKVVRPEEINRK